ncbi:hypothetical protein HMPREF0402_04131 [Fusobacterium ulcerans 12-1B]|uniref:Uncharacterized protein n=1 Tax=Fusobacterium ulcerans 12-1B TaxID=457404 RepID=S2KXZ7_9FUSO|nr:hypothetical protein HMPREF0402_04131 [Fusobacterium ulcerans 12-1B]
MKFEFNIKKILLNYLFYGYIPGLIFIIISDFKEGASLDISLNMFRGNLLFALMVWPICYLGRYAIVEIYKLFIKVPIFLKILIILAIVFIVYKIFYFN